MASSRRRKKLARTRFIRRNATKYTGPQLGHSDFGHSFVIKILALVICASTHLLRQPFPGFFLRPGCQRTAPNNWCAAPSFPARHSLGGCLCSSAQATDSHDHSPLHPPAQITSLLPIKNLLRKLCRGRKPAPYSLCRGQNSSRLKLRTNHPHPNQNPSTSPVFASTL